MWGVIGRVCVAVWMGCFTVAAAQLPPDVMVDKYLLEAKLLTEEKDYEGALKAMDRIVALQKEHDLTLPEAFPFQYAQTALAADAVQATIDSANRYLTAAGREGKYYRETLELLVKAERRLQEPAADRVGSTPVKPDLEPQPQAVSPSSLQAQKTTKAQPEPDCGQWNTRKYFQKATVESVTACLAAGADLERDKDKWSPLYLWTPLHVAAKYNENPAVIETLLKAGADPKARAKWKSTPLHYAAEGNENPAVIETLLKAGADPKARAKWKSTPLHYAAGGNENPAVIEALLKAGADPNARHKLWERTPLHYAARFNGNPAVIEALLKAGADPNAQDTFKRTPLSLANEHNENPSAPTGSAGGRGRTGGKPDGGRQGTKEGPVWGRRGMGSVGRRRRGRCNGRGLGFGCGNCNGIRGHYCGKRAG